MSYSIDKLNSIRKEASEMRDRGIKAKATMEEVENNIANLKNELLELGIKDTNNIEIEIEAMERDVDNIYKKILEKMDKYK